MIETVYKITTTNEKTIERIMEDAHAAINHIVLPEGKAIPEHDTNSNVYMIVVRGTLTLQLGEQDAHLYTAGSIIAIPYQIKMNASNAQKEVLEFFVVKAPSPKTMIKGK